LSAERVASELLRLLAVPNPVPALRIMVEDGVLAAILPEARRLDRLERLIPQEPQPDPLRRLAALVETDAVAAEAIAERLRLSNAERERLAGLARPWPLNPAADARAQRRAVYDLGAERYRDLALLLAAEGKLDERWLAKLLDLTAHWAPPRFPLAGRDVTALGIPPGPPVGQLLIEVRQWWEEADFAPDRAACLDHLRQIIEAGRRPAPQ
jgi:poly(A) polymerase